MYPLDWPTHPESIKALNLSLFLIVYLVQEFPNISFRTSISFVTDIIENRYLDWGGGYKEIKKCLKVMTSMIFDSLRKVETCHYSKEQ